MSYPPGMHRYDSHPGSPYYEAPECEDEPAGAYQGQTAEDAVDGWERALVRHAGNPELLAKLYISEFQQASDAALHWISEQPACPDTAWGRETYAEWRGNVRSWLTARRLIHATRPAPIMQAAA